MTKTSSMFELLNDPYLVKKVSEYEFLGLVVGSNEKISVCEQRKRVLSQKGSETIVNPSTCSFPSITKTRKAL